MRHALFALAACVLLTSGAALAAEAVVVAATAPGYTPGQRVAEGAGVRVPDGATLRVLFANGRSLTVTGPYDGPLERTAQGGGGGLSDLLGRPALAQTELAASRAVTPVRDAPLDLVLSTDQGAFPTYRPGDPVRLMVRTNRDAHLVCTLRDGRGTTTLLFPTAESGGSRVTGGAPLLLPGERMPAPLRALTDQEVRCVASDRDWSEALPRPSGLVPLSAAEAEGLEKLLATGRPAVGQVVLRVDGR